MAERLDVIIFGATGFTGKYTVLEAVKILKDLKWGIAGRNNAKLEKIIKETEEKTKENLSKIPIIIADIKDEKSLQEMAQKCKVVVNCCGPYRLYGEAVIKACINAGTHHVDVSAEAQYMEAVQLEYNDLAKEKGIYLISACGFESVVADLGLNFVEKHFNGVVNTVETYLESWESGGIRPGATIHYGTLESGVHFLAQINELREIRSKLFKQKLLTLEPELQNRPLFFKAPFLGGAYCLPFPGPDACVVRRSQRFLYEIEKKRPVQIKTYIAYRNLLHIIALTLFVAILGLVSQFSFGRTLILKYPKLFTGGFISHEGPSEEKMKNTKFAITFYAEGWKNEEKLLEPSDKYIVPPSKTLIAKATGINPGYGGTCVALLLSAKTILKENDKIPGRGGVLPPGAAFAKTTMINELGKYENGFFFEIVSSKENNSAA